MTAILHRFGQNNNNQSRRVECLCQFRRRSCESHASGVLFLISHERTDGDITPAKTEADVNTRLTHAIIANEKKRSDLTTASSAACVLTDAEDGWVNKDIRQEQPISTEAYFHKLKH